MIETKLIIIETQNVPAGNYDILFSQLKSKLIPLNQPKRIKPLMD